MKLSLLTGWAFLLPLLVFGFSVHISLTFSKTMLQCMSWALWFITHGDEVKFYYGIKLSDVRVLHIKFERNMLWPVVPCILFIIYFDILCIAFTLLAFPQAWGEYGPPPLWFSLFYCCIPFATWSIINYTTALAPVWTICLGGISSGVSSTRRTWRFISIEKESGRRFIWSLLISNSSSISKFPIDRGSFCKSAKLLLTFS